MKQSKTSNQFPREITELGVHCVMHDSYSPQEQKYIFMLEVFDQPGIREVIRQRARHGQLDFTQFRHSISARRLEVPFKALEPVKSHYGLLEKALLSISQKPVSLAYTVADPKTPQNHIMQYVQVDQLFQYVGNFKKGQVKYALIDIPLKTLQLIDTIDLGYHKIMPSLYLAFQHQSTRRLYQLAETRLKLGYVHFKPSELKAFLSSKPTYRGLGNFRYNILDNAIDEFKEAYKQKMIDYFIECEVDDGDEKYSHKRPTDLTLKITFRADDTKLVPEGKKNDLRKNQDSMKELLIDHWKVQEKVASDLSKQVTLANTDRVRNTFHIANLRMVQGNLPGNEIFKIKNPAGYIVTLLKNAFKS